MPDPVPAQAAATPAPAGTGVVPFITGGGGFALGLFSTFGVKDLLASTQHALALTVFGLVTCLILVIAIATMDLRTLPKKGGGTFAIGAWATGITAVVMLLFGFAGVSMIMREYWVHTVAVAVPAETQAYYTYNLPGLDGSSGGPLLLVNGRPNSLELINHKPFSTIEVPANATIEVRVPTLVEQQNTQRAVSTALAQGAGAAP
jgi:hypothetical protein